MIHQTHYWAKTVDGNATAYHSTLCHMIDVGQVARLLLGRGGNQRYVDLAQRALGTTDLAGIIALHDIGKVSSEFQGQVEAQARRLGIPVTANELRHEVITRLALENECSDAIAGMDERSRQVVLEALGGHHGKFHSKDSVRRGRRYLVSTEDEHWASDRVEHAKWLRNFFGVAALRVENISVAVMTLTGLTILCDWVGSDQAFFAAAYPAPDINVYHVRSEALAFKALRSAGLLTRSISAAPRSFGGLFCNIERPRPLQLAINAVPDSILGKPFIALIEDVTGSGKTEASQALAHKAGLDEMYVALPTMATSNQMHARVDAHVTDNLGLDSIVTLVHSGAHLMQDDEAEHWFVGKKKALLAPTGVGTVDQCELAALNVKHTALRLVALAGKCVIIDEVHAYDAYMLIIIERLLQWFHAINTSVILLSATLPAATRQRLLAAYGANDKDLPCNYPSLIVANLAERYVSTPTGVDVRRLSMERLDMSEYAYDAAARWLVREVEAGGCVCWIANTVDRAQRVYEALLKIATDDVVTDLLHSQFPLEERLAIEKRVVGRYGRNGERPIKGIVVGTQVLEQSLDLDFDVMVSDLAPIDLLIQRAGRIHRHERHRPHQHQQARLYVRWQDKGSVPSIEVDEIIYDRHILLQTHARLPTGAVVELPKMSRDLIEAVYGDVEPTDAQAYIAMQKRITKAEQQAKLRLLPAPDADESAAQVAASLIEFVEDENSAAFIVAQTRLADDSINAIPMLRDGDYGICGNIRVRLDQRCDRQTALMLLRRQVRISKQDIVEGTKQEQYALLDTPLLRYNRLVWIGQQYGRRKVELDSSLGLTVRLVK